MAIFNVKFRVCKFFCDRFLIIRENVQKNSHLWQRWRNNATKAVEKRDVIVVCK